MLDLRYRHVDGNRHEHAAQLVHVHEGGEIEHDHKSFTYYVTEESFDGDGTRHIHKAEFLSFSIGIPLSSRNDG